MSRSKRGAAGREPVTEATLRADSLAYVKTKVSYHLAFSELWDFPPDGGSLAAPTAVVLGKLLEYQEAFKAMMTNDALFLLRGLKNPAERKTAETLYRRLMKKLDRASVLEQELRTDRVVFSAHILACLRRSGGNG